MIEVLLEAERALTFGRLDLAERLYRQVADTDPKSSIAVVGLARVALERGDDRAAYVFARGALAIDADNPAAQHLVMRLAEVMAGRGEAAPPVEPAAAETTATTATPSTPIPSAAKSTPPSRPGLVGRLLGRKRRR
jgi:thioredoxin-like negative regulator of GroEL